MIRFFFRTLAAFCLAIAIIFAVLDATRSIGLSSLVYTNLGETWVQVSAESLRGVIDWTGQAAPELVTDVFLANALEWPTSIVFAALAAAFYLIGHKRKRKAQLFNRR